MKKVLDFFKAAVQGGFFVLFPLLLFSMFFKQALQLVVAMGMSIAALFSKGMFDQSKFPAVLAMVLIVVVSFLIGLVLRSEAGRRLGGWIEGKTLGRLPTYNTFKSLTSGFKSSKESKAFRPALLNSSEGTHELAYVIEDYGDGTMTVMLPWSPTPFAGSIKIVDRERVTLLDTNLGDFTMVVSHWGIGTRKLITESSSTIHHRQVSGKDTSTV